MEDIKRAVFAMKTGIGLGVQKPAADLVSRYRSRVSDPPGHPYFNKLYGEFVKDKDYCAGAGAVAVAISDRPVGPLFRICSLATLLNYGQVDRLKERKDMHSLLDAAITSNDAEIRVLHQSLVAKQSDWGELSQYVTGCLSGPEMMSWWTTHRVSPERIYEDALKLGLCRPVEKPLVLQLDIPEGADFQTFVPAESNAVAYPVFHAMPLDPPPAHGLTIDLSNAPDLVPGHPEYIISCVPVKWVKIMAVEPKDMPSETYRTLLDTPTFWEALLLYYTKLAASYSA